MSNMTTQQTPSNININKALVSAIAETKDIHADSTNPFHKSKYASLSAHLSALKGIFSKHGLAVLQFPAGSQTDGVGVTTRIIHASGEFIEQTICIPISSADKNITGQQAGALISYLRRYALASVAGVATEDDDAELDRVATSGSAPQATATSYAPAKKAYTSAPSSDTTPAMVAPNAFPIEDVPDIESILMPFGKNKGNRLVDLSENDWSWIVNKMELKPFNGKISKKDITLKNAARILLSGGVTASQNDEQDQVPF